MDKQPSMKGGDRSETELEEVREFLGPLAAQYSEEQLEQLRREMYAMAELLLDIYLYKNRQRIAAKKTGKDFDMPSPAS